MERHPRTILLVTLAILFLGVLSIVVFRQKEPSTTTGSYTPPVARANPPQETVVTSPDGKLALKMREEKGKDVTTFIFIVTNSDNGSQKEIFRKDLLTGSSMEIPRNTFSPDDKYLFLKEVDNGVNTYLVLSASGVNLTKDNSTLEISGLFAPKYPDYKITDVTGWGGVNLIVFNTDLSNGGQGPSFWFEVPSTGFIRLGTRFN